MGANRRTQEAHPSVSRTAIALDAKNLPTVCVLCSHNCGIRVDVQDGRITEIRADHENPISHGYICNKAVTCDRYAHHEQRVLSPLQKQPDGSFEPVDWDTAIADISARLRTIRDEHGSRALAACACSTRRATRSARHAASTNASAATPRYRTIMARHVLQWGAWTRSSGGTSVS